MRYEIGQKVPFINFEIRFLNGNMSNDMTFFIPWEVQIIKTNVVYLTCIEHHKVRGDYDDDSKEPAYDGFVFVDVEGHTYYNQYPRASYGQVSDSADKVVLEVSEPYHTYKDGFTYLEGVQKGIYDFTKMANIEEHIEDKNRLDSYRQALDTHFKDVKSLLEEVTGLKIGIKPLELRFTDGKPAKLLPGYFRCFFESTEQN